MKSTGDLLQQSSFLAYLCFSYSLPIAYPGKNNQTIPMKRFFSLLFVLLSFCLTVFLSPAHAQTTNWVDDDYATCMDSAVQTGDTCSPAFTSHQVSNLVANGVRLLVGPVPGVTTNSQDQAYLQQMSQRSLVGGVSRTIAMIYAYPPASFGTWIADVGQTLGFIPKSAYAQGIGFSGLAPLLPVWKAFRNIAYLVLAIVMIAIGFMVMLRKKIDPKTVVTVQNALPRIVVTLILITFSYAIVGFLIDLMYLVILLVVTMIGPSIKGADIAELQATYTAGGFSAVLNIFDPLKPLLVSSLPVAGLLAAFFTTGIGFIPGLILVLAGGLIGSFQNQGFTVGLVSPLLVLILLLALIITLIRIFFLLINAYVQIVIALLFGPLQIMIGAIPGGNGFSSWLNNLIVNLVTFPVVITLIIIGTSITANIESATFWSPPLVPKLIDSSTFIRALLGFGIIMTIPNIVHGIKEALKIKPALPIGAGSLTAPLGAAGGVALQGLSAQYYIQPLIKEGGALNRFWTAIRSR